MQKSENMKSHCYPLVKSIEYQTSIRDYQPPQPRYRVRTNNQLKATLLFNLLNNQNAPVAKSPSINPIYAMKSDQHSKTKEMFLVPDEIQENHYENNDIISLNVDFSTDGTENETTSKTSSRSTSSSSRRSSDDENEADAKSSLNDSSDTSEKLITIYNDAYTTPGSDKNIPGNCSLELSALSTFSSVSSGSMTIPPVNGTASMPSISMELESINKNLRTKLKESKKRNRPGKNSSDTSVFTSISSTYSNNNDTTYKLVKSTSPYKTVSTSSSQPSLIPSKEQQHSNNVSVTVQSCRMPGIQSIKRGGNLYEKYYSPKELRLSSSRIFKEKAPAKKNLAPEHTPARPLDTLPKKPVQPISKQKTQSPIHHQQDIGTVYTLVEKNLKQKRVCKPRSIRAYNTSPIEVLDNYLLVLIFSKLNTVEKLMLQFVCKRWHHLIWSQEYSYMLFRRIDINQLSIPLHRHILSLRNNSPNDIIKIKTGSEQAEKKPKQNGFVKFIRSKFSSQRKKPTVQQQQQQSSEKLANTDSTIQQLSDLKENNFLKFHINADLVLDFLLNKLLNRYTYPFSICVESIQIKGNHWLTDRGIDMIGKRCPELTSLCLKNCSNIKTPSMMSLLTKCPNIKTLNLTGCFKISNLIMANVESKANNSFRKASDKPASNESDVFSVPFEPIGNYFYLQFIDLSYCSNITDNCILQIGKTCIYLRNLYLKKCQLVTDISLLYVTKYCFYLRELSFAQCNRITDLGIKYLGDSRLLAERNPQKFQIKYLNLSKCSQITDESLIFLSNQGFFKAIRHLNLRGCSLITDKFFKFFSGSRYIQKLQTHFDQTQQAWNSMGLEEFVPFQLKSLDLAFCPLITDKTIEYLCRMVSVDDNLERLCMSNCTNITDYGIRILALNCKLLGNLNVKKCPKITSRSLKDIKVNCRSCIIQHTNFSFC